MNKTYQELCDENLHLREQLEAAEASAKCARLTSRQALAKAEVLEQERDQLALEAQASREAEASGLSWAATHFSTMDRHSAQRKVSQRIAALRSLAGEDVA